MNSRGEEAEKAAADYLLRAGLRIIARNWHCRHGELDIIAREGGTLVFIEVRQRRASGFGGAAASINATKRAKLVATAQAYLQTLPTLPPCRFDAVCFEGRDVVWLKNCIDSD